MNLPSQLGYVHNVFHVSILKRYKCDPPYVLPYADIPFQTDVTYEEQPTKILAREVCLFHHKETSMVKVRWEKHTEEKATWELEFEMYEKCPYLFWCTLY